MGEANNDWVIVESGTSSFPDECLNKRYKKVLCRLGSAPTKSIPGAFKSWGETLATYRFFNNKRVSETEILSSHKEATIQRIKKEPLVLIPQDTSTIDFSQRQSIDGMGYLNGEKTQGFYLHPSLAITPDRQCLGVVDFQAWVREELGKRKTTKNRSIEEKESFCWIKSYEAANQIALSAPDTTIISIADREGDIYELMEKLPSESNKAYWLVRCQQNRLVIDQENDKTSHLWEMVKNTAPIGEIEFTLPAGKTYNRTKSKRTPRKERIVQQVVRAHTVHLQPAIRKGKKRNSIAINVIHCEEINAPEDEKIKWFLLTSYPIKDAKAAIEAIEWYLCRWQIELFFKILKSGCTIEELQFETYQVALNCVAMYSIISTKKPIPEQPPSLHTMIIMIAKLGGFLGRKLDGYPSSKVMWTDIQRMKDFAQAWEIFQSGRY